jgi:hypothetical protein
MKPEFFTRGVVTDTGAHALIMTVDATDKLVHICFAPESKTFLAGANWNSDGTAAVGGGYVCIPK